MPTDNVSEVPLTSLSGESRPINEWTTTFQLALVVLDPYTMESSKLLGTAGRILRHYAEADCRTAFLMNADELTPAPATRGRGAAKDGLLYLGKRPDLIIYLVIVFMLGSFGMHFQLFNATMSTTVFGQGAEAYGLLGTVLVRVDFDLPIGTLRAEFERLLESEPFWDGRNKSVQVTDAGESALEVRLLMSARGPAELWQLRVSMREKMLGWLQTFERGAHVPRARLMLAEASSQRAEEPEPPA